MRGLELAVGAPAGTSTRVDVVSGERRVLAAMPEVERLARGLAVPATARTAWIRAQLDGLSGGEPWAIQVRAHEGPLLAAAVVLEDADRRLAGGGDGHRGGVLAVDEETATTLGRQLALETDRRGMPQIGAVLIDDAVTRAFAAGLGADVRPAPPIPALAPDHGPDLAAYLSHGMLRTLRKARNRLDADNRDAKVVVTRRGEEIVHRLAAMERIYRASDERHGVASDDGAAAAWRARLHRLMEQRLLELTTLTVDGRLAAYVLGIDDGPWYRVLDGRFDAEYARYAPGRLLEAAVLKRVLAAGVSGVDWMTGVAPETLIAATTLQPTVELRRTPGTTAA